MADPAAVAASSAGEETIENKTRQVIRAILLFCLVLAAIGALTLAMSSAMRPAANTTPVFSVMVSDIVGGLDPLRNPLIQSALDLTLRVDNPMDSMTCWENATVTVSSYGNTVLGLGHLFGQLCVDKGASVEVKATLSQVHVMLPDDRLRGLMVSKLRAGELELLVQLRMLLVQDDDCARDINLHYCRVSPGYGFSPCNCHTLEIAQKRWNF